MRGIVRIVRLNKVNYSFALDQQKSLLAATRTVKYPQLRLHHTSATVIGVGRFMKTWLASHSNVINYLCLNQHGNVDPGIKVLKVGSVLLCEHKPVYTFGLRDTQQYQASRNHLLKTGAEVFKVRRGGLATFHGPGQLVCYPILNLRFLKLGVKEYVSKLEQSVINVCDELNVVGIRSCDPGVWVGNNKICAIGIQVTHGISWHGMAINCSVDLSYFQHITACGLEGKGTTSFSELLGRSVQTKRVEQILLPSLEKTLQVQLQDVNQIV